LINETTKTKLGFVCILDHGKYTWHMRGSIWLSFYLLASKKRPEKRIAYGKRHVSRSITPKMNIHNL
jgi:hypothetical protein